MSLPVLIEAEAMANISHAANWWADHRDAEQALRWYEGIMAAIESLRDNPTRCVIARESASLGLELREMSFGLSSPPTHRIIFLVDADAVRVLTVRHAAQDDWNPR